MTPRDSVDAPDCNRYHIEKRDVSAQRGQIYSVVDCSHTIPNISPNSTPGGNTTSEPELIKYPKQQQLLEMCSLFIIFF